MTKRKGFISSQSDQTSRPVHGKNSSPFFNPKTEVYSVNTCQPFFTPAIQPKLTVNTPDDIYEKEADAVADKVMRMPDPQVQQQTAAPKEEEILQMQPVEEEEEQLQMQPIEEEEEKLQMTPEAPRIQQMCPRCQEQAIQGKPLNCPECENKLQRKPAIQKRNKGQNGAPPQILNQLNASKGRGSPLNPDIQQEMSKKMGADFSNVKVHTDSKAIQMNRQLGAKAFTHSSDIYFNKGKYNPASDSGKHLLAHELTHVVQQDFINKTSVPQMIQRSCMDLAGGNWQDPVCDPPPSPRSVGIRVETEIAGAGNFSNIGNRLKEVKIPGANKAAMHNEDPIEDFGFADLIEVTYRGPDMIKVRVGEIKPLNQHGYVIGVEEANHYKDKIKDYGRQCGELGEMEINLPANRSIRDFCIKMAALEDGHKAVRLDEQPFILWPAAGLNLPSLMGERDVEVHNCGGGSINYRCTELDEESEESEEQQEQGEEEQSEPGSEEARQLEGQQEQQGSSSRPCAVPEECPSSFCRPYSSRALALIYRAALRNGVLAGITAHVGTRVLPVWIQYLYGGSSLVDYSNRYGNDFTNSERTRIVTLYLTNALLRSLRNNPPEFPVGIDRITIDIHSRIRDEIHEIYDPNSRNAMNFNYTDEIPGNIAGGIGSDQTSCPVGAIPSNHNDLRWVKNESSVEVIKNEDGSLKIVPDIQFVVVDTVDLCPGDCGNELEQIATIPLSRFEASRISGDVPFLVNFPSPSNGQIYTVNPRN